MTYIINFFAENKTERLYEHSYLCLEKCIDIATQNYTQNKKNNAVKLLGDSYFKLAEYVQSHNDNNLYQASETNTKLKSEFYKSIQISD